MLNWLRSKLSIGPKAVSLPEAQGYDPMTMFLGRVSSESKLYWEHFRLPEVLAAMTRVGTQVTHLRVRQDLRNSSVVDEIIDSLRPQYDPLPSIEWVDRV